MTRALLGLLVVVLLAGCGTSDDRDQARAAVERFTAALEAGDGAAACAELSGPLRDQVESRAEQPCAEAIADLDVEGGPIDRVEVYVTNAKVDPRLGRERVPRARRGALAALGDRLHARAGPTGRPSLRVRGGVLMRSLFVFTLSVVWAGILFAIVIGALSL